MKKPGEIDTVEVYYGAQDALRIAKSTPASLPGLIKEILSGHADEFERLCDYYVENDARFTLDQGSVEIEDCEIDDNGEGLAYCGYTQSFYAGCRDRNINAEPRDCVFDIEVNRIKKSILVSMEVPPEREPDQF